MPALHIFYYYNIFRKCPAYLHQRHFIKLFRLKNREIEITSQHKTDECIAITCKQTAKGLLLTHLLYQTVAEDFKMYMWVHILRFSDKKKTNWQQKEVI